MGNDGATGAQKIRQSMTSAWRDTSLQSNCSGFLKRVAKENDITLEGRANDIIEYIAANWQLVPTAALAADEAGKGSFIVAVLKGKDHADKREEGHVAIVLPGELQPRGHGKTGGSYPLVWCAGGKQGKSDGTRTVGDVWTPADRNNVKYYKYSKPAN